MDKQIEIQKSEDAFVNLLNQEMKELQAHQNKIEEMARVICRFACDYENCDICPFNCVNAPCEYHDYAINLINADYRKIPENAVVLTREEHQKYLAFKIIEPQIRGCLDREQIYQRTIENLKAIIKIKDEHLHVRLTEQTRKETVEKFADRLKLDVSEDNELHEALNYYLKRDYFEYIDERCKEMIGEKNDGK